MIAHITLPTGKVKETAAFLERTLGWGRLPVPSNSPVELVWFDLGLGQSLHVFEVKGFAVSPFESEFGRHFAFFFPRARFDGIKRSLAAEGAEVFNAIRPTPFERFFFRDPINGYVFEVIETPNVG